MAERWDSNQCRVLKTKNLTEFSFLTIRWIRTKAVIETRIEHAGVVCQLIRKCSVGYLFRLLRNLGRNTRLIAGVRRSLFSDCSVGLAGRQGVYEPFRLFAAVCDRLTSLSDAASSATGVFFIGLLSVANCGDFTGVMSSKCHSLRARTNWKQRSAESGRPWISPRRDVMQRARYSLRFTA